MEVLRGKLGAAPAGGGREVLVGPARLRRRAPPAAGSACSGTAIADAAALNDEQLAWKARAALRAADWQAVRDAIDRMSVSARQDPAWTYWYGRALDAQGNADGARAYYLRISGQPSFYGLLAAEELGSMAGVPEPFNEPSEAEVGRRESRAGARARARALPARPAQRGDARMGVHDPRHGRRAAARGRRARAPRRRLRSRDQYRRPHGAPAQLQGALPRAVQGSFAAQCAQLRPGRGLGARPGAAGKPLHRQREVLGRRAQG